MSPRKSAQRQPGLIRDLAHGGGSVALREEQFHRGVLDGEPGHFTFFRFFFDHVVLFPGVCVMRRGQRPFLKRQISSLEKDHAERIKYNPNKKQC